MTRTKERWPAVRASSAHDMLGYVDEREPGSRARIWQRMPAESRAFIDGLRRSAWIPIEHDHWLPESIIAELGLEAAKQHFRRSVPSLVEKPLLEPLIAGMLRILGDHRRRVLQVVPKGWGLVFRDFCEPTLGAANDRELELRLEAIPPIVREHPVYFELWESIFLGLLDLTRSGGELDYRIAPDASTIHAHYRWPEG